ncbi:hypothetical protein Ssi03_70030 [Sphaerisporangium siamense]|uniref:Uncharacterized protein n=1 Tax=Sphaerisporangium siamense TaxID=795645 RepID=A0A7W7G917_9ACTN|nr:hypothetical protein [Sphaerisporangium siamense]MBB4702353.1 hypothetical protein [Sphaerisporangium siamense]GII89013.1 hypothetical protein Ssi03_70030 [Sphaerisporangium siamense]
MSIYATLFCLDADNHEPGQCAVWREVPKSAGRWDAATTDGRYWVRVDAACTCGNGAPLIYQGSHVNPSEIDAPGGSLLVCGIPDHCHPDVRGTDDAGRPVEFLRVFASEDERTYRGGEPGQATLILDLEQVTELRDMLNGWLESRTPTPERGDGL